MVYPPFLVSSSSAHSDPTRLCLLGFGQGDGEDPVLHLRPDAALIDLVGKRKAASIMADIVFRVDWLHALVFGEVETAIDVKNASFHMDIDIVLIDARHLQDNGQCIG